MKLCIFFIILNIFVFPTGNIAYSAQSSRCIEMGEQGGPYSAGCDDDDSSGDGDDTVCYFGFSFPTGSSSSNQASAYANSSYPGYENLGSPTAEEHDSFSINADLSGCAKVTGAFFQGLWDGIGDGAAEVGKFFQSAGKYLSNEVWQPFVDSVKGFFNGDEARDDWYKEQEEKAKSAISVQEFDLKTMGKQIDDFYDGIDPEPGDEPWRDLEAVIYTRQIGMRDWYFELKAKIRYEDILPQLPSYSNDDYPYETPRYTPEGNVLEGLQFKIEYTNNILMENGGINPQQADLIDGARAMGMIADDYYKDNDRPSGNLFSNFGDVLLDAAIGIDPITAFARDAYGVVMGVDPVTGEALSDLERVFTVGTYLLDVALPGSGYGTRALTRFGSKALKFASKSRIVEGMVNLLRRSDHLLRKYGDKIPCLFTALESNITITADCDILGKLSDDALERRVRTHNALKDGHVGFGSSTSSNYRQTYLDHYPEYATEVGQVHHAVEQQVLDKFPGVVSESEIHSLANLRGIPDGDLGNQVHLGEIRQRWNAAYDDYLTRGYPPTKEELLDVAKEIDDDFGEFFVPPIR